MLSLFVYQQAPMSFQQALSSMKGTSLQHEKEDEGTLKICVIRSHWRILSLYLQNNEWQQIYDYDRKISTKL